MKEIEVKILEINIPDLIVKLEKLKAKKVLDAKVEGVLFKTKSGFMARLRKMGDVCELTTKTKISKNKVKVNEEYNVNVSNYADTIIIMKQLGYVVKKHFTKQRISFQLGDAHFDIDVYPDIPPLLEIEADSIAIIKKYTEKLGYSMKDAKPWTAKDVYKYYGKKL